MSKPVQTTSLLPARGPRVISNSGGRTSGLMTLLEMRKGLGPEDYVLFCNTGKERPETLDFLHRQQTELGVPLIWLEYCRFNKWKQVSYETASRNGQPFEALMTKRPWGKWYTPNVMARYCTQELKIRVMRDFMISQGHRPTGWTNIVGIRYDEPRRHANGKHSTEKLFEVEHPLFALRITKPDVLAFWRGQRFDLELQDHAGNCDLCFLKGRGKLLDLIRQNPAEADWWIEAEQATGGTFNKRSSYADLKTRALTQATLDFWPPTKQKNPSPAPAPTNA